jgi:hypothetical protein
VIRKDLRQRVVSPFLLLVAWGFESGRTSANHRRIELLVVGSAAIGPKAGEAADSIRTVPRPCSERPKLDSSKWGAYFRFSNHVQRALETPHSRLRLGVKRTVPRGQKAHRIL